MPGLSARLRKPSLTRKRTSDNNTALGAGASWQLERSGLWRQTMSFRDFDLPKAQEDFGLSLVTTPSLFADVPPVPISTGLAQFWSNTQPLGLALITEKARSELLAAPLLSEVWHRSGRQ